MAIEPGFREQFNRISQLVSKAKVHRMQFGNADTFDVFNLGRDAKRNLRKIASLCAASVPSTSRVGSASA